MLTCSPGVCCASCWLRCTTYTMADAGEAGGDKSRFLHVDGKATAYFTSCGSTSFRTLLQHEVDACANKASTAGQQGVAAPSPKRRSPKKLKVG